MINPLRSNEQQCGSSKPTGGSSKVKEGGRRGDQRDVSVRRTWPKIAGARDGGRDCAASRS